MSGHGRRPASRVLHQARLYDALVWALTRGRDRQFRRRVLDHARLTTGQSVLDVGCGTGTLAILARDAVGAGGDVHGTDASPQMIARARRKAAREGVDVAFATASIDALPFPGDRFDAVLATLMLHHLPPDVRGRGIAEVVRVLEPGGRFLAVDLGGDGPHASAHRPRRGILHGRHGHPDYSFDDVVGLVDGAGLEVGEQGRIESPRIAALPDIRFVVATKPG